MVDVTFPSSLRKRGVPPLVVQIWPILNLRLHEEAAKLGPPKIWGRRKMAGEAPTGVVKSSPAIGSGAADWPGGAGQGGTRGGHVMRISSTLAKKLGCRIATSSIIIARISTMPLPKAEVVPLVSV